MRAVPKGKDPFLGAAFFLIPPGPAEGGIETVLVQRLNQALGLHHVRVQGAAVIKGVYVLLNALRIDMHNEVHAGRLRNSVPELVHGLELPAGVHMHERKWRRARVEGFFREAQHHRRVLADGIQHDRVFRLGHDLTNDVDALRLQAVQMSQVHAAVLLGSLR